MFPFDKDISPWNIQLMLYKLTAAFKLLKKPQKIEKKKELLLDVLPLF